MKWILIIFAVVTLIGTLEKDETPVRITFGVLTGILLFAAAALEAFC